MASYPTLTVEGGLFSDEVLDQVGQGEAEGQRPQDFGLADGRRVSDETQALFSDARTYWDAFQRRLARSAESRITLTRTSWMLEFLELLGFRPAYQQQALEAGGERFVISHRADGREDSTPIHIVGIDDDLDRRPQGSRRSPHAAVQEYLNRSDALWGLVTNGARLRLLRDTHQTTKPTFLEFDLRGMMEGNQYPDFVLLYRLLHASRFPQPGQNPDRCWLENYYRQTIEEGGRVREKLREGVERALTTLGTAFLAHPQSEALRQQLASGQLRPEDYYRQLLRLIYRLLFLMVAEERGLLALPDPTLTDRQALYTEHYSVRRLRDRAERYFRGDRHTDVWLGLRQTFRALRDPAAAALLGLTALNGELFGPEGCAALEAAACENEKLLEAILALSRFHDDEARRSQRVNYARLDVEELGSVYESLLDYHPQVATQPWAFYLASGSERKQTGSYYTPPTLVRELIESALVPVIQARLQAARTPQEQEQALLGLRVCDPASGSGHFLLAAARRIGAELARVRTGEDDPPPQRKREATRDVIRTCIYGVDKNPLAVDLCKVALWIEGHTPGLPLSFLDHHIKHGDSLVGVFDLKVLQAGVPDAAYTPVTGDDKAAAAAYRKRNQQERTGQLAMDLQATTWPQDRQRLASDFETFAAMAETNPAEVQAKADLYAQLRERGTRWWTYKVASDLWTAAFFVPLVPHQAGQPEPPTTAIVRQALLHPNGIHQQTAGQAMALSARYPFFHWPLEFPEVFERGGFDVVLGNPPWEQIQLDPREFFATSAPAIAAQPNMAARERAIARLQESDPPLYEQYRAALHDIGAYQKFIHESTRFPKTSYGRLNSAPLFAETCLFLVAAHGRAGLILPTGIATDAFNQYFFASLVEGRSLVSLFDFENREKVFPGIDSRLKFCLLTLSGGGSAAHADFAFFLTDPGQLNERERRFTLAPADFALFNPNTRTAPTFRTRRDAEIARKLYRRAGVLWREARAGQPERNPWGLQLQLMFMMNTDSHLFRTHEELTRQGFRLAGNVFTHPDGRQYLPLYEAKLFHQYDHRFATFAGVNETARKAGNARQLTPAEKANPGTVVLPRYWVPAEEVAQRLDRRPPDRAERERERERERAVVRRNTPHRPIDGPTDHDRYDSAMQRTGAQGRGYPMMMAIRLITNATNQRTLIGAVLPTAALGHKAAVIHLNAPGSAPSERPPERPMNEHSSPRSVESQA